MKPTNAYEALVLSEQREELARLRTDLVRAEKALQDLQDKMQHSMCIQKQWEAGYDVALEDVDNNHRGLQRVMWCKRGHSIYCPLHTVDMTPCGKTMGISTESVYCCSLHKNHEGPCLHTTRIIK